MPIPKTAKRTMTADKASVSAMVKDPLLSSCRDAGDCPDGAQCAALQGGGALAFP